MEEENLICFCSYLWCSHFVSHVLFSLWDLLCSVAAPQQVNIPNSQKIFICFSSVCVPRLVRIGLTCSELWPPHRKRHPQEISEGSGSSRKYRMELVQVRDIKLTGALSLILLYMPSKLCALQIYSKPHPAACSSTISLNCSGLHVLGTYYKRP